MSAAWVAVCVTIGIFMLGHIFVSIWWASKMNVLVTIIQASLGDLVLELKAQREIFYKKEDALRDLALFAKERDAMWKRIDEINDKINQ